jgi:hypothetical protein
MAKDFLLIRGVPLRSKVMKRNKRQLLMKTERVRKNLSVERPSAAPCLW